MTKKVTAQGILDFVYNFIRKQGPSTEGTRCRYRTTKNGKVLACAAGCILSDVEASELLNAGYLNTSWYCIPDQSIPDRFRGFRNLICGLQYAHDVATSSKTIEEFGEVFEEKVHQVAIDFGLQSPVSD